MSDEPEDTQGKPFKITDSKREVKKGIVASNLRELTSKSVEKMSLPEDQLDSVTIVLENDGTEIDDEEYFATLEAHTGLMVLAKEEKWKPPAPACRLSMDTIDDAKGGIELAGLVGKLKHNLCHVSLLGGAELELLSDMDPESIADITFPDRIFLEQLKEASGRYLSEKRQAKDAMDLLKIYQESEATTNAPNTTAETN